MSFYGLNTDAINEFSQQWGLEKRRERNERTRLWQLAHETREYEIMSPTPQNSIQFFSADETVANPFNDLPAPMQTPEKKEQLTATYSDFVKTWEEAYIQNQETGSVDMSMFLKYDIEDLKLFQADGLGIDLDWLANRQALAASHADFQRAIEAEVDKRYEARLRGNDFNIRGNLGVNRIMDFLNPFGDNPFGDSARDTWDKAQTAPDVDRDAIRNQVWLEFTGQEDKVYEEQIGSWRERRKTDLLEEAWVASMAEAMGYGNWARRDTALTFEQLDALVSTESLDHENHAIWQKAQKRSRARWTDDLEERLKEDEETLRTMIIAGGDPATLFDQRSAFSTVVAGTLQGFQWGLDKLAVGAGGLLWAVDGVLPGSDFGIATPYQWFVNRHRQGQADDIAEYEQTVLAETDEQVLFRATQIGAEQAWEEQRQQNSEAYQESLAMAGGDEIMAAGLFIGAIMDSDEVRKASEQIIQETRDMDDRFLEDLREQDFRFSHEIMDVLAMWGRNGPGRISTAVTLLLTDKDHWDNLTAGNFRDTWHEVGEEASQLGFTPSAAVGIDGSMAGLALDMGTGIFFDPTTYFLGPKFMGAAKGALFGTADNAAAIARSAPVRAMVDDIINFAQSPMRNGGQLYKIMSWLDDTAIGEVLHLTGMVDAVIPRGKWAKNPMGAQEVSTSFLRRLIPEGTDVGDVSALADDIAKNGFDEALEITISRADGSIAFSDGVKRVFAADSIEGATRVPVRLKIVDDASAGNFVHPDDLFLAGHVDDLKRISESSHITSKVRKAGADDEARLEALAIANDFEAKAIQAGNVFEAGSYTTKDGRTLSIKKAIQEIDGDRNVVYYAVDDVTAEAVASVVSTPEAGITMGTKASFGGQGIMEHLYRTAHGSGDYILLNSGRSASMSDDAVAFSSRMATKLLDEAAPRSTRFGVGLDDILEGGELKRALRPFADGVGDVFTRPDMLLPGRILLGEVDKQGVMAAVERGIMRGSKPSDGARVTMYSSLPGRVRQSMVHMVPQEVRKFFTQANVVTRFDLHGPNVIRDVINQTIKIWGDDIARADSWAQRFLQHQIDAAKKVRAWEARQAAHLPQRVTIERLMEMNGGGVWDDTLKQLDDLAQAGDEAAKLQLAQAQANRKLVQETLSTELKSYEKAMKAIQKELGKMPDQSDLAKLVQEMWEDFNRQHIVPRWADEIKKRPDILDKDKGILRWEELQKARKGDRALPDDDHFLPESLQREAAEAGLGDAEKLYRMLNSVPDTPMSLNVPLSPLDMIAASSASGSKWIKWNHNMTVNAVRDTALAVQKAWIIDKVLRPATAMTVSGDELLRIFHKGGRWAVGRYLSDRALFTQARIQNALHAGKGNSALKGFFARDAVRRGSRYSDRVTQRLRRLDEYTVKAREWERIFYDDHGIGWTDIWPDDPLYRDAAKQWTANFMQESGFRAFLRGEEAFKEWFFSVDGAQLRNSTVLKKVSRDSGASTGVMGSVDEAYKGWQTVFERVILKEAKVQGVFDDVLEAFKDVARQVDEAGGKPIDLPDWVYEHLGPVRGVQKHNRNKISPLQMTDAFFDRFFLDPVQYRRGFVADMVAQQEKARITALLTSQDYTILTDLEVAEALGVKGMSGATRTGVKEWITQEALKRGMVPQSHIDDLVQRAAMEEMDHMLYVAERGSRAGRAAQAVFPFGKPYADMMAFWGREMLRRPHFRGQAIERNVLGAMDGGFGIAGDATKLFTRFNPRTPALVSRLAHTDFTIDRGWDAGLFSDLEEGETAGLFPGSEQTSLAPLAFLPTGGENPFYSMIPGMGYVPMWALDMIVSQAVDPIEDPLGYQTLIDNVGDVIGGAHFGAADPGLSMVQRVLGGGTFGQVTEAVLDVQRLFDAGDAPPFVSTALGQPDREIDRGRYASAILADPEEWVELLALEDDDAINLYIDALALEADENAAIGNLQEQISRFALPANNKFSGELDVIWDVWLQAGMDNAVLGAQPGFDPNRASPEERRRFASDVRSNFFDLPQWQRDALVAENPTLAVNLVSSWTWTDLAYSAGVPNTEVAYRTDGSREGLARHNVYIQEGYVRPLAPQERLRRIVGLALSAKESAAKGVYTGVASNVNAALWEQVVGDADRNLVTAVYNEFQDQWEALDLRSPQELWAAWGAYEGRAEEMFAEAVGVEQVRGESTRKADRTEFDELRSFISLDVKPWSETWTGLDPDSLSKRMAELQIPVDMFSDDVREQAAALDIELVPGMTGAQLYGSVQMRLTELNQTLLTNVDPAYQTYLGSRTAVSRAIDENLRSIMWNQSYSEEWRGMVKDFEEFETRLSSRWRDAPLGIPSDEMLEVQDRFMKMMQGADDNVVVDWQQLWEKGFERNYGPLNWVPPEPRIPWDEGGAPVEGAYQPFVHHIIDGDSLVARNSATGPWHEVRLLGVRARDYGLDDDGATEDKDRLWDALQQAVENDDTIWLVRDAGDFGNVDIYGRELAWLWIGDEPFYFQNEMLPNRDPAGSGYQDPFGGDE